MNERLAEALDYVDGKFVAEAARRKKNKKKIFLGAMAAILALVLFINTPTIPFVVTAQAVAIPGSSRAPEWHGDGDHRNSHENYESYRMLAMANAETVAAANQDFAPFFAAASHEFLTGTEGNALWSPVNAAVALAILAETADGTTRQEILDLLGVADTATLREYIARIWEAGNETAGNQVRAMASSLWVDNGMKYDRIVMDTLAYDYYASVYQGNLGGVLTNNAIQTWVNNHTGGFLNRFSSGIDLAPSPDSMGTVMALVSTVYLKGTWHDEFDASNNTDGIFHAPGGDKMVTYMNQKETHADYYWGESFGAVRLGMKNDTTMWLILPDKDKTTADVLAEGEYLGMLGHANDYENSKYMKVNLSLPIFDIQSSMDLREGLENMGILNIFDGNFSDFTTALPEETWVYISSIDQATRLSIDEDGLTAASYIVIPGTTAAEPPEEIIDFVLDRPFLFVVTGTNDLPLFTGVINQP